MFTAVGFLQAYIIFISLAFWVFLGWVYSKTREPTVLAYLFYQVAHTVLLGKITELFYRLAQTGAFLWLGDSESEQQRNVFFLQNAIFSTIGTVLLGWLLVSLTRRIVDRANS